MLIRTAKKDDFEQIDKMFHHLYSLHIENRPDIFNDNGYPYSLKWFTKIIKDKNSITLVYEDNGEICGFCFGKINSKATPTLKTIADIDDIFVDDKYRKKGIATLLYKEFEQIAKQSGAYQVRLCLWSFNREAEAFYRKMGMNEQRVIMEKNI